MTGLIRLRPWIAPRNKGQAYGSPLSRGDPGWLLACHWWNACFHRRTNACFDLLLLKQGDGNWNWHSNGARPVDEFGRELFSYSAQSRNLLQLEARVEAKQQRNFSNSWLARSLWPLYCGWNPEEWLTDAPSRKEKAFQYWVNWGPQSDTISWCSPRNRKTCWIMITYL